MYNLVYGLILIAGVVFIYLKFFKGKISFGFGKPKTSGVCPMCNSDDIMFSPKRGLWICNYCKQPFAKPLKSLKEVR